MKKIYFTSIDGLRALSCLGIILMHIQANTQYELTGNFIFDKFIPSLTWLVYLFIMISGFGMCAGYLDKFNNNEVDLEKFYKKRYMKIFPFFAFLLLIALIMERNIVTIYEGSIELLLIHGLLPNNDVSVLGVCWTLGVIFLFYLLFPFFSVLLKNKKRAWFFLGISLWVNYVLNHHFFSSYFVTPSFTPRHSFIYCIPLFLAGGLVFLYRNKIIDIFEKNKYKFLLLGLLLTAFWYLIMFNDETLNFLKSLILFPFWLSYAIGISSKFLSCKIFKFFSKISMEMYLAQMIIFRAVEKFNLLYLFGNSGIGGWLSFILTFILVVIGLVVFIKIFEIIKTNIFDKKFRNNKKIAFKL